LCSIPLTGRATTRSCSDDPADANAIAGDLIEVFGVDLTEAKSVCASCGTSSAVAEADVYVRGPGRVARCRGCGALHIVLVTIRGITCVDLRGIAELEMEIR
jgi:hypothetical protein